MISKMNKKFQIAIGFLFLAAVLLGVYFIMKRQSEDLSTNGGYSTIQHHMTGIVKSYDLEAETVIVSVEDKYDELTLIDTRSRLQKVPLEEGIEVKFYFFATEPEDRSPIHIDYIELVDQSQ